MWQNQKKNLKDKSCSCRSLILFLFVLSGLLSSCGSSSSREKQVAESTDAEKPAPEEVIAVKRGALNSAIGIPGELSAWQQVDLYAKQSSFVSKLFVDVGSEVRKGQLLAVLDAPELVSRLAAEESRLKSQEARYMASNATYQRLLETSKTPGTISKNDLEQALARRNSDVADLEAVRASYKEVAALRNYLSIRAPFNGVITARNIHPGAFVGNGNTTPLFTLQQQDKLRLVVSVPEAYTPYLRPGDEVAFTVKSRPDDRFKATVVRFSGALDERLRSERIEMDVPNRNKVLLPGMVAEVALKLSSAQSIIIPKSALVTTTEGYFVIKVTARKAEWRSVDKGRESDETVEVAGNIKVGDVIVKNANEEIRRGSLIPSARLVSY